MDNPIDLNNLDNILSYCDYCHGAIYVGDNYVSMKGQIFHIECMEIKGTYYDPMDDEELD